MPLVNTDALNAHLAEIARITRRRRGSKPPPMVLVHPVQGDEFTHGRLGAECPDLRVFG